MLISIVVIAYCIKSLICAILKVRSLFQNSTDGEIRYVPGEINYMQLFFLECDSNHWSKFYPNCASNFRFPQGLSRSTGGHFPPGAPAGSKPRQWSLARDGRGPNPRSRFSRPFDPSPTPGARPPAAPFSGILPPTPCHMLILS